MTLGTLYGVGVGPGAPDLMTLRALDVLRAVPVVAAPRATRFTPSMAWRIASAVVGEVPGQERLFPVFPMKKDPKVLRPAWDHAMDEIGARLERGLDVAFVVEGDPMLYSSFVYLLREAPRRWPDLAIEIVPGISSVTAVPAVTGVPLADGMERVAVLPATYGTDDLVEVLGRFDTVVLMKIGSNMPRVLEALERTGLRDRAVFVSRATMREQRVVPRPSGLGAADGDCFSMILVTRRERSGVLAGDATEGQPLSALADPSEEAS